MSIAHLRTRCVSEMVQVMQWSESPDSPSNAYTVHETIVSFGETFEIEVSDILVGSIFNGVFNYFSVFGLLFPIEKIVKNRMFT